MIGISTLSFDLEGSFILREKDARVRLGSMSRRGAKTATLDGGTSRYDTGLSHGDREFEVQMNNPSVVFIDKIKYLIENYSSFRVVTREGAFTALITSLNESYTNTSFIISIEEKVT